MKLFKFTAHAFLPETRKVSTHFIAEEWAKAGHTVHVASIGLSYLTYFKDRKLFRRLNTTQKNHFIEAAQGLNVSAYIPPVHPFSSKSPVMNLINRPVFGFYGNTIPEYMKAALAEADAVFFEPGTGLCFYEAVRRINPNAVTIYFKRDWLKTIGAAPCLIELERRIYRSLDLLITPSAKIAGAIPLGCRAEIVPQGINKHLFDAAIASPYATGTRNAISVGNMLFDEPAVRTMAGAAPEVTFHVFGAKFSAAVPGNVVDYGEKPFAELIPFIKFADFGIAPYKMTVDDVYLSETSLKFQQYAYCGLPVLTPDIIPDLRGNLIGYALQDERDWRGKIDTALAMGRSETFKEDILSWAEVAGKIATLAETTKADRVGS